MHHASSKKYWSRYGVGGVNLKRKKKELLELSRHMFSRVFHPLISSVTKF